MQSVMLSVTYKSFTMSVTYKSFKLSVIMLNVVMQSVVAPSNVMMIGKI